MHNSTWPHGPFKLHNMGAHRHGQGGYLPPSSPPGNVEKCFLLQMSKTSVDEVCMHHFEKTSSASGVFAPRPSPGNCPWTMLGDFRPSDPSLPTPGKMLRTPTLYNRVEVTWCRRFWFTGLSIDGADDDLDLVMDTTCQVIKWTPFQQSQWAPLVDDAGHEL